jgi:DUF4097 and DUF4098 domain-containing protein YvlB
MAEHFTAFPVTSAINLLVKLNNGSLRVTAIDGLAEATVRLTPEHSGSDIINEFTVEMDGSTLTITAPRHEGFSLFRGNRDGVDVEVRVPSGTAMKLNTGSAPIIMTGRAGGADVASGSGRIDLDTIDGDLRVRHGSAHSSVKVVTGDATLRSGSGNAQFGEVTGNLDAGFGSGNLEVLAAGGSVRSHAGSGDATIKRAGSDIDFRSGSGTVHVGLPVGTAARLDLKTGSGKVRSDLPIADAPAEGSTSIMIKARTGSGDVRLFRAA